MHQSSVSTCTMLIVEDDRSTRDLLTTIVKRKFPNCTIFGAANGIEGYEMFKEFSPDIVIADINLPVMDGINMVKMIKSRNPETALIALTANPMIEGYDDLGFCSHIKKPFNVTELFAEINRCCPPCHGGSGC